MRRREFLRYAAILSLTAACRPAAPARPTLYAPGQPPIPVSPTPSPVLARAVTPQPVPTRVPITDQGKLYVKNYRLPPDVSDVSGWTLTIDGLVRNPITLPLAEILALPTTESERTLQCISNPVGGGLVGNLIWRVADFAPLLARAGVLPTAKYALFEAADGYTTSVALKWITQPGVVLVTGANGEALTADHGYPFRILMPGLYGQKMPKWLTRVTFSAEDRLGYWESDAYAWSNVATVKTNSILRAPNRNVPFIAPIRVEGLAYAGDRAITSVEIAADQRVERGIPLQGWQPARLIAPPTPLAWTWWVYDWTPPAPGLWRIGVRAKDSTGYLQAIMPGGLIGNPFPDGTDAIHTLLITVG
jgi:DMSO/TMAO reductase YedYZ molybdopterin-dependent catalytic subunit